MNFEHVFVLCLAVAFGVVAFRRTLSQRVALAQGVALDYEQLIPLDAENLAEQGIGEAYEKLLPQLKTYIAQPAEIQEVIDADLGSYAIRAMGQEHVIYSPNAPGTEQESWGRATYFFFLVVNSQLAASGVHFHALYGGNDLGGMFLTPEQAQAAQVNLPRKADWPYIPQLSEPWYGQFQ